MGLCKTNLNISSWQTLNPSITGNIAENVYGWEQICSGMMRNCGCIRSGIFYFNQMKAFRRPSQVLLLVPIILLLIPQSIFALKLIGNRTMESLVKPADIGVVGHLSNIQKRAAWGKAHASALIHVDEVLFGNVAVGDTIPISWTLPNVTHGIDVGEFASPAIWLLPMDHGEPRGNLWDHSVGLHRKAEVIEAMAEPLIARQSWDKSGTTYTLQLMYRNLTTETINLPAIKWHMGKISAPAGTTFQASYSDFGHKKELSSPPGRVHFDYGSSPVRILPGKSYVVNFDLEDIFDVSRYAYEAHGISFQYTIPGVGSSNELYIRQSSVTSAGEEDLVQSLMILVLYSPTREVLIIMIFAVAGILFYRVKRRYRG